VIRLSVTARLALLATAVALLSNFAVLLFIWHAAYSDAINALRRDTVEQGDALVAVGTTGGTPALIRAVEEARAPGDRSLLVALYDSHGQRIAGAGPHDIRAFGLQPTPFRIALADNDEAPWSVHEAGFALRRINGNWLLAGRLLDGGEQAQRTLERALGLGVAVSLVLGLLGGLVVTRFVGLRLSRIARVAEGVAAGDLSQRVQGLGGHDAFDRLGLEINAMLDKIERLMGELRVVTDSLAHDLRSPLSRLRSKIEAAVLTPDAAQREAALAGLLGETDLVLRMLTTVIEISRSEGLSRDQFVAVPPAEVVEALAELYAPVAEDAGLVFALVIEDRVPATPLHRELLSQAIANLLDNAMRHGAGGGAVTLRLTSAPGEVRIQVEDRGPGIAAGERETAKRRFGRLDNARSIPGAGLGLALVEAVARLHGGRLELADNAPGLVAAIVFPTSAL
jgi:signal transduction histidine kinase